MADLLSKKATVKNICGTNPVMIHPVGATRIINPGQEFTGMFPLAEITAMENSKETYSVTSAAEHKSEEPDTDENSGEPVKKLTKAEKEAAKAAQSQTPVVPVVPVVPPAAPALPGAGGLPSALQIPGSGN